MNDIKGVLDKYACTPYRYTIKNNVLIVDTDSGCFAFKKRKEDRNSKINDTYNYLKSRSFEYFPKLVDSIDDYDVYEYIDDIETPREQKAADMINLISLLHSKTTYFKEMDMDEYKAIYENNVLELDYLYNYYTDLITSIEKNVYMSPAEYLLARNISKVFGAISFCQSKIDEWYELIQTKSKKRMVTIHNNLDIDHLVGKDNSYLLSWDKVKQDMPIHDLYKFYKKYALEFDFFELLRIYESKYPLLEEERNLLFVLLSKPERIFWTNNEYKNCKNIYFMIEYLYKTELLIKPYYSKKNDEKTN